MPPDNDTKETNEVTEDDTAQLPVPPPKETRMTYDDSLVTEKIMVKKSPEFKPKKEKGDEATELSLSQPVDTAEQSSNDMNKKMDPVEVIRANVIGSRHIIETPFGKKEVVYADYTASGRCLYFVEDFMTDVVAATYANTHTEASATGAQTTHHREEARKVISKAVNAPAKDYAVLFTGTGTTAAVEKLFRNLGFYIPEYADKKWNLSRKVPMKQRPVIFISHFEHHSNELMWRESLGRCVVIKEGSDGTPDLVHLRSELMKYKLQNVPMIGSFSAGSNVTGIRAPVRKIAKLLHEYGAYAFFDYAGVGAYVQVDVAGNDLDAVFFSPHKFIGGPGSSGVLIARHQLFTNALGVETKNATTPGGGTIYYTSRVGHQFVNEIENREDGGTPAIMQAIKAGLAFKVKEMVGSHRVEELELQHSSQALKFWLSNNKISLMGADRPIYNSEKRVTIFSFNLMTDVTADPAPERTSPERKQRGRFLKKRMRRPTDDKGTQRRNVCFRDMILSSLDRFAKVTADGLDAWTNVVTKVQPGKGTLPLHYNFVVALLNDIYGIQARGGCSCAGPYGYDLFGISHVDPEEAKRFTDVILAYPAFKPGWARVNLNYFITHEEAQFIIEAVDQIADFGWKILYQYIQDPMSGQFLHRSAFSKKGVEIIDNDKFFSLNDLQMNNTTKVGFPRPKILDGERDPITYHKVLDKALKLYDQAEKDALKPSKYDVTDFVISELSPVVKPEDIWWLLPTQAEKRLVKDRPKGWDLVRQNIPRFSRPIRRRKLVRMNVF